MSDIGIGDTEFAYLDVAPADNTTNAVLTVEAPDGTNTITSTSGATLIAIPGTLPVDYSQRWTSDQPIAYSQAGRWVLHWQVNGTGEGAEDSVIYVVASPTAGGPTWAPGRSRPAAYLPHRTLVRNLASTTEADDSYAWTWDSTTIPPGTTVDRLVADGVAWVSSQARPLNPVSYDTAAVVASLYAAAAVERGWPQDDSSLQRANDLERRMDALMTGLIASNTAAWDDSDQNPETPELPVLPQWSFPPAPCDVPGGYGRRFDGYPYY